MILIHLTATEDYAPVDIRFSLTASAPSFKSSIRIYDKNAEEFTVVLVIPNNKVNRGRQQTTQTTQTTQTYNDLSENRATIDVGYGLLKINLPSESPISTCIS